MRAIWLILLVSVAAAAADEKRAWTFSHDGKMHSPSGGEWSFKKKGRLDATLIRLEGTNVIVLATDGQYRIIPTESLSENDRAYLLTATGISESQIANIRETVSAKSAESRRKSDAARFNSEAAAKRRLAELEIEAAGQLENEAARLGSRANSLEYQADRRARFADRIENSAVVPPEAGLAYVNAKAATAFKTGAADRLEGNQARLSREAAEKRANADRLGREAANLEQMARSMELGARPGTPASR
jgi:hypothetical protein